MAFSRRDFLGLAAASGVTLASRRLGAQARPISIDRQETIRRQNPRIAKVDPFSALSVGNGQFAFTADVTGLQTFTEQYRKDFPLCTASHWGWHTTPLGAGLKIEDFRRKNYDSHGRLVGYATDAKGQEPLFNWLRENPHRLHLGRIGFEFEPSDLSSIDQELDLWSGVVTSRFRYRGQTVRVRTACHPEKDLLAVSIESAGPLEVLIAFPYASPEMDMADWKSADRHTTIATRNGNSVTFERKLDEDRYVVQCSFAGGELHQRAPHEFILACGGGAMELVCLFSPQAGPGELPSAKQIREASAAHWADFWSSGGCVDLSESADSQAQELERRIVLSQYNTALHCSGPMPPAETGLLYNTWYGKFHLEMHWWHAAHFAAWNRFPLLERSLDYYQRILPRARENAARQGYRGCRWPKMVGPEGRDSPSPVAPLLIWQQPHPIYFAELCYRQNPSPRTLEKWRDVVFGTADFLASFAALDGGRYVLGPPLKTVSENTGATTTTDPTFELAYWRFGLRTAQEWRRRLGMYGDPVWGEVQAKLAPLPTGDGVYLMQEGMTDTYTNWNWEHPALLGVLGAQPGDSVDLPTMRRTLHRVMDVWQWDRCWGWDFPMAAMCASKCGQPELAVRALMIDSPKNRYHPNGHNYQRPGLTAYLPGNGGLLSAVAMMCLGGGFPKNWSARFENLSALL
jgi:protein-glucosylgalactosylhydroxylysine glucosidase